MFKGDEACAYAPEATGLFLFLFVLFYSPTSALSFSGAFGCLNFHRRARCFFLRLGSIFSCGERGACCDLSFSCCKKFRWLHCFQCFWLSISLVSLFEISFATTLSFCSIITTFFLRICFCLGCFKDILWCAGLVTFLLVFLYVRRACFTVLCSCVCERSKTTIVFPPCVFCFHVYIC
ncbi:hypothetical protein BJ508DRAFT_125285 [Ascobolus immersus RN42]|uniref:Uncharacterized protein n=1 Tax=Ascobolus immersus RN42 TaxID=1160509 RepID=A0A3N4I3P7_ASCIM|nr:hypothetical protein BJ508DRAFT_125285 [Ascobolus immersus RN42]